MTQSLLFTILAILAVLAAVAALGLITDSTTVREATSWLF